MKLSEVNVGKTFTVAGIEFIKMEDTAEGCVAVTKESLFDCDYGSNNNFSKSKILKRLNDEVLPKIEEAIGTENVLEFTTDLTALDGLKTYGSITSKICLPTLDFYRQNVKIFDEYKLDEWWWLATPDTTPEHYNDRWAICVAPNGNISYDDFNRNGGVRPVLVFVSDIFVSLSDTQNL